MFFLLGVYYQKVSGCTDWRVRRERWWYAEWTKMEGNGLGFRWIYRFRWVCYHLQWMDRSRRGWIRSSTTTNTLISIYCTLWIITHMHVVNIVDYDSHQLVSSLEYMGGSDRRKLLWNRNATYTNTSWCIMQSFIFKDMHIIDIDIAILQLIRSNYQLKYNRYY